MSPLDEFPITVSRGRPSPEECERTMDRMVSLIHGRRPASVNAAEDSNTGESARSGMGPDPGPPPATE